MLTFISPSSTEVEKRATEHSYHLVNYRWQCRVLEDTYNLGLWTLLKFWRRYRMSMRKKQGRGELVSGDGCTYHMGYWQKIKPELGLSFYLICQGYSLAVIVDSVIYRKFGVILSYRLTRKTRHNEFINSYSLTSSSSTL